MIRNLPDRVEFVTGGAKHTVSAVVSLVGIEQVNGSIGAYAIEDVSVRLSATVPLLAAGDALRVLVGPLAGSYTVKSTRRLRDHTRYIVSQSPFTA